MTLRILELEERLNHLLPQFRLEGKPNPALLTAAKKWSEAVWEFAEREVAHPFTDEVIEHGLRLSHNPIHICGVHRSGTTLVRDLLDGHPSLSVLPSEGSFFTNTQKHLKKLPQKQWQKFIGCEWLRRLANSINQPPYWLLGRSTEQESPYVFFARSLMAWRQIVEERFKKEIFQQPLLSVVLAYTYALGKGTINPQLQYWVEKTPTNEKFLDRLWKEFPSAKVIHVVRHPVAVYASRKKLEEQITDSSFSPRNTLRDMAVSYRTAVENTNQNENYFVLKFEDLVEHPSKVMKRLAEFLHIEFLPILLQPTVAGIPSLSNSSFNRSDTRGEILTTSALIPTDFLTMKEQKVLSVVAGEDARTLGYDIRAVSRLKALWLKGWM
jgi:hypothetical protein